MKALLQGIFRTMGGSARRGLTVYLHCSYFVREKETRVDFEICGHGEFVVLCMREIHEVLFVNFFSED